MKQLLGFVMFWIGVGILTTFFMPVNGWFVRALAAFSLMIVGYNLFSSGGKCGREKIIVHMHCPAERVIENGVNNNDKGR